ncbi:hypothetical protein BX666DRAFT_2025602 [Dichotomocladium elegans]|nr:hypothetical protein BX666DRAFT_2025602 [Dichotomocladium elegans]
MPGVTLEDPFPIARFHNVIPAAGPVNKFAVDINPVVQSAEIDAADRSDQVLVSVQSEGIKLYNSGDQKCLKSWMIPPGIILAQPAIHRVCDTIEYTFALVSSGTDITEKEENKIVWMWKSTKEDTNTDNRVAKTFNDRIQAIHISPALPSHLILVNENGSIALMTNELDRMVAKTIHASSGTVIWSNVFVTSAPTVRPCCISSSLVPVNSTIILTISSVPKTADKYTLSLYYCNEERRSIDPMVKTELVLKEAPVDFTFDSTDGRISVLGSAGTWSVWRMHLRHTTGHKVIGEIEPHLSMHFKGYRFSSDKLGKIASIASLDGSYIALVAPRIKSGAEGLEHVVSIWDMKYGTLQAERILQLGDKSAYGMDKCVYKIQVLPNQQQLAISVSSISTSTKNQSKSKTKSMSDVKSVVVLCPYYNERISLMAAMGRMSSTVAFLGEEDALGLSRSGFDAVTDPNHFAHDEKTIYDRWLKRLEKAQDNESDLLASLLRPTLTVDEFTELFFDALPDMENPSVSNGKARNSYVDGGIVPALLERNDWDLIMVVLDHLPDIPETAHVALLSAFIEKREAGALPQHHVSTFFAKLLTSPYNEIFLQQALKQLTVSELPMVLDLILQQLKQISENDGRGRFYELIELANGVLDSHYPVIILEPSMYETVRELQELVDQEACIAEEMVQLKSMMRPFERKHRKLIAERQSRKKVEGPSRPKNSSNQGIPVYRVEVFQF